MDDVRSTRRAVSFTPSGPLSFQQAHLNILLYVALMWNLLHTETDGEGSRWSDIKLITSV